MTRSEGLTLLEYELNPDKVFTICHRIDHHCRNETVAPIWWQGDKRKMRILTKIEKRVRGEANRTVTLADIILGPDGKLRARLYFPKDLFPESERLRRIFEPYKITIPTTASRDNFKGAVEVLKRYLAEKPTRIILPCRSKGRPRDLGEYIAEIRASETARERALSDLESIALGRIGLEDMLPLATPEGINYLLNLKEY